MSTELTTSPQSDLPMVESQSLSLTFLLAEVQDAMLARLTEELAARGHPGVTASALGFLGHLDCGINYAAGIAEKLNVSRQMVAKTVAEMERAGWLVQGADPQRRNRKVIRFTAEGERLMADARDVLAKLDEDLARDCGRDFLPGLTRALQRLKAHLGPAET
jgi:DNA-binding MarR family transcriptional regulator